MLAGRIPYDAVMAAPKAKAVSPKMRDQKASDLSQHAPTSAILMIFRVDRVVIWFDERSLGLCEL